MKERYKKAFEPVQCIAPIQVEEINMKKRNSKLYFALACSAFVLIFGGGTLCYAQDIGGFRTQIEGWFHGKKEKIEAVPNETIGYEFYKEGETEPFMGGGGVEYDAFGREIELSAEDVFENNAATSIEVQDGKVMLYDHELTFDITDYLKNGKAKVSITRDNQKYFWDIEVNDSSIQYQISIHPPKNSENYVQLNEEANGFVK